MAAFVPQEDIALVVLTNIQGKGLAMALMYEALDCTLGVDKSKTKDWSAEYLNATKKLEQEALDTIKQSDAARIADAPASHELKDYAGTYTALGYADILVKWEDNALWALNGGEWFNLVHYHYDVFELDRIKVYGDRIKLSFSLNIEGAINQMYFPIEPELGNTAFTYVNAERL